MLAHFTKHTVLANAILQECVLVIPVGSEAPFLLSEKCLRVLYELWLCSRWVICTEMLFSVILQRVLRPAEGLSSAGHTLSSLWGGTCCEDDECGGSGSGDSVLTLLIKLNIDCCDIVSECGILCVCVVHCPPSSARARETFYDVFASALPLWTLVQFTCYVAWLR